MLLLRENKMWEGDILILTIENSGLPGDKKLTAPHARRNMVTAKPRYFY